MYRHEVHKVHEDFYALSKFRKNKLKQAKFAMLDFIEMIKDNKARNKAQAIAIEIEMLINGVQDGKIS